MRGFDFTLPVDANYPLDPLDPPPRGWDQLDTSDFRRALHGFSSIFQDCCDWEEREKRRHENRARRLKRARDLHRKR